MAARSILQRFAAETPVCFIHRQSLTAYRLIHNSCCHSARRSSTTETPEDEFRVYEIEGLTDEALEGNKRRKRYEKPMAPPRSRTMAVDQDWTNVWPTAANFKWSVVPFPVRQGYVDNSSENQGVVPSSYGNLELMKPPNFLHLTPAHVKKHCAAIKKFCTEWPEGLDTDSDCRHHFPVESTTSDFVFSGPSTTDERARLARIQVHISDMELDYHAKDKFIRLVGDRYDPKTDLVVFESDRCPLKSQNMEYVNFLLTAVYFESWKREPWESLKQVSDMETYRWEQHPSKTTLLALMPKVKGQDDLDPEAMCDLEEVKDYRQAVERLCNHGEDAESVGEYKMAVTRLLGLKAE